MPLALTNANCAWGRDGCATAYPESRFDFRRYRNYPRRLSRLGKLVSTTAQTDFSMKLSNSAKDAPVIFLEPDRLLLDFLRNLFACPINWQKGGLFSLDFRASPLIHPLSNVRRWRAATGRSNGKCPDIMREAAAAWQRFVSRVQALPPCRRTSSR
jgi:hypothetical protein